MHTRAAQVSGHLHLLVLTVVHAESWMETSFIFRGGGGGLVVFFSNNFMAAIASQHAAGVAFVCHLESVIKHLLKSISARRKYSTSSSSLSVSVMKIVYHYETMTEITLSEAGNYWSHLTVSVPTLTVFDRAGYQPKLSRSYLVSTQFYGPRRKIQPFLLIKRQLRSHLTLKHRRIKPVSSTQWATQSVN